MCATGSKCFSVKKNIFQDKSHRFPGFLPLPPYFVKKRELFLAERKALPLIERLDPKIQDASSIYVTAQQFYKPDIIMIPHIAGNNHLGREFCSILFLLLSSQRKV